MSIVDMGLAGIGEVYSGTHLCALYTGQVERDTVMYSFLREGLRAGDRCVCIVDDAEAPSVRDHLTDVLVAAEPERSEQLHVGQASDMYLEGGSFSVDRMITFLADTLRSDVEEDGFGLLRAICEMSWVLPRPHELEDFFAYESAVNGIVEGKDAVCVCLYDVNRFEVSLLVEVLKTHPRVLLDRAVLDNPHYQPHYEPPVSYDGHSSLSGTRRWALDPLPATRRRQVPDDPWLSVTGAELRVIELVSRGLSNREVAEQLTVSRHTVDAHLKHIYAKLNIHSRVELTVLALQRRTLGP